MLTLGALIFASMIVVAGLVINAAHIDNEILKQKEERRHQPWDWN